MSETETRTGKLTLVEDKGGIEETAASIIIQHGLSSKYKYDSPSEMLMDVGDTHWVICGNKIYEVEEKAVDIGGDIFEATPNSDGTIRFLVQYYNGGCSFEEAIETALKRLEDK